MSMTTTPTDRLNHSRIPNIQTEQLIGVGEIPHRSDNGAHMAENILKMIGIWKRFPGVQALADAKLEVNRGEVVGLIGENGAGKSTMMKILLGSYQMDSGEMYLFDKPYKPASPMEALNRGISMMHQEISLVQTMSVAENIWIGREDRFKKYGLIDNAARRAATVQLLKQFQLEMDPDALVETLSIARMQLVEILRAISYNSDIIIMDEPTSALTNSEVEKLFTIIHQLTESGKGIIFISHKLDEVLTICDRVTVMRDGKYIDTRQVDMLTKGELVSLMVGRDLTNIYERTPYTPGKPVMEVKNLCRSGAFKDISFQVRKGEILGFCGLMGAGRTEVMEAIYGITRPDSGEILINGKPVENQSPQKALENGIGMVTEDRLHSGVIHRMSVKHNMTLSYLPSVCKNGFVNRTQEKKDFDVYAKAMNVKFADEDQEISVLSGGNQQKVVIGKCLLTQPEVIILDEPTRGIDVGAKAEIYRLIDQLALEGKAVIMISSELPELMGVADRILVMSHGQIRAEVARKDFDEEVLMRHAF